MRQTLSGFLAGCLVCAAGSAILAAPDQLRPGEPTQARVWVQNRGKVEAVPVSITDVSSDAAMRVQVTSITSIPPVTVTALPVVLTKLTPQVWEYRTITVPASQDPATALQAAGRESWEATGLQVAIQSGIAVVLKRPR